MKCPGCASEENDKDGYCVKCGTKMKSSFESGKFFWYIKELLSYAVFIMLIIFLSNKLIFNSETPNELKTQYKIVYFDREDHQQFQKIVDELGKNGWMYSGQLTNDGINAHFVLFYKRRVDESFINSDVKNSKPFIEIKKEFSKERRIIYNQERKFSHFE